MNKKLLLITSAAIASASIYSFSGVAVAADGTATVTVQQALTITNSVTDLAFGTIISPAVGGTVVIAPGGGVSGDITPEAGTTSAGEFTVSGENGKGYAVTVPTGDVTLLSGTDSITVNTFTYATNLGVGVDGTAVSTGGALNVGATLNVALGQAPGSYTGTYVVTVNYN